MPERFRRITPQDTQDLIDEAEKMIASGKKRLQRNRAPFQAGLTEAELFAEFSRLQRKIITLSR